MSVRFVDKSDRFRQRIRDAANAGLTEAASALADGMTEILGGDHGGVPSKPGDPPHSQTGTLGNSMHYHRAENLHTQAGSVIEYGKFLELGTWKMLARPWLRPAYNRSRKAMQWAFDAAVKLSMKRSR